jgi:hypothetical protein
MNAAEAIFREQVAMAACSLTMKNVISDSTPGERNGQSLLVGTFLAALLAVIFGACLLTILDVTRQPRPDVALSKTGATGEPAPNRPARITASF